MSKFLSVHLRAVREWIGRWITSPKVTRALAGPLLYSSVRAQAYDFIVQDVHSILVVRLTQLAIFLMSPFLRELRRLNPDAWITLVVDPDL